MFYYHVWVRSIRFRGNEPLTYEYGHKISLGSLVLVSLKDQQVLGIIIKMVPSPTFTTKPILRIFNVPPVPIATLELASWLHEFYPSSIGVITSLLLPEKLDDHETTKATNMKHHNRDSPMQPPLTDEQIAALSIIRRPDTYLLHGRTGSGKTRIYTELTARTLLENRSVLVLSPEIGLTSQLAISFKELFGDKVMIFHSRLTQKARRHAWRSILAATSPQIIIGPRSVLFSPICNLGLIIVDESHDQAYKQEQAPYYSGVRVASRLSKIHHAILVFGSATPDISDYYLALKKKKTIIKLHNLAKSQIYERQITIVDLKDRVQFSRTAHLSLPLIRSISNSLSRGEQSLLYLNRRGTARVAFCRECGWQACCPNCNTPLIYHGDDHLFRCHICGFRQSVFTDCSQCGNPSINFKSFGTKAIVEEVQGLFPEARIVRFDADSLKADRLENRYTELADGSVDILVGTQMLAKGLDLPHLSTLGIILADSSLYVPDYTAHERMYQMLTQVIGRIGRGHVQSHAIIQTYQPDSDLLRAALQNEWDTFYNAEILERKKYLLPPFYHILKLTCARVSSNAAEKTAKALAANLALLDLPIKIEGPAPAFHEKSNGKHLWQLVIKSHNRVALITTIRKLPPSGWTYDIDPIGLL